MCGRRHKAQRRPRIYDSGRGVDFRAVAVTGRLTPHPEVALTRYVLRGRKGAGNSQGGYGKHMRGWLSCNCGKPFVAPNRHSTWASYPIGVAGSCPF